MTKIIHKNITNYFTYLQNIHCYFNAVLFQTIENIYELIL